EGQTGRLLFASLGEAPGFRPGDFVTVRINEPPLERVSRVPASAVDAGGTVLVVGDEERLNVASVDVMRREGDDVLIRARSLEGREIVAERTPLLGAGIRVRPVRPGAPSAEPQAPELLELDPDRRARLVTFVEGNQFMPAEAKARVLAQLKEEKVPARVVERIESRMN
ncbi:MAG: efflux transporter periplasmic adaptor subunit, partial [Pseudomonadota bacterium]